MPILDRPISRAEYYASRYDKLTPKEKKARKELLELQRKGYDTSSIAYDDKGQGYSIAPEVLKQQQELSNTEGTFKDEQGKGYSQNPDTVPKKITRGQYGLQTTTYFSGRRETTSPYKTVNIYGREIEPPKPVDTRTSFSEKFKRRFPVTTDIFKFEKKIASLPGRGLNIVRSAAQEGAVNRFQTAKFTWGGGQLTPKEESNIRSVTGGFFDVQKGATLAYVGAKAGGDILSKASPGMIKFVTSKPVSYSLTGLYVAGTAKNVIESDNKFLTLAKAGTEYYGMSKGVGQSKVLKERLFSIQSKKPVQRVEGFKVNTRSVSFDELTTTKYYGKNVLLSGRQKSQGAGLYKIGDKYFRVIFREKGISRASDVGKFTRSTGTLKIQPYGYGMFGKRYPTGTLKTARMTSEQVVFPTKQDNVFAIRGLSKIKVSKQPQITRLVTAKALVKDSKATISGLNVDTFKGKVLPNTGKEIRGFNENMLEYQSNSMAYSMDKGYLFGRNRVSGKDLLKGLGTDGKSIKGFRREELISGANSLLIKSSKPPNVQVSISEPTIRGLISKQYAIGQSTSQLNSIRFGAKPITTTFNKPSLSAQVARVNTPQSISRIGFSPVKSRISLSGLNSLSKVGSSRSIMPKSSTRSVSRIIPATNNMLKITPLSKQQNIPAIQSKVMSRTRQATRQQQLLRQNTMLRQKTISRTATGIRLPNIVVPPTMPPMTWNPKNYTKGFKMKSGKGLLGSKYKYVSSIESRLFNIRGRISKSEAKSGLIIRPVVS